MYEAKRSPAFERDVKKCARKHRDLKALKEAMLAVLNSDVETLPAKYNDHALTGNLQGYRELHVDGRKSDWLVLYSVDGCCVEFVRTGNHDDIFR